MSEFLLPLSDNEENIDKNTEEITEEKKTNYNGIVYDVGKRPSSDDNNT